jgi:hypothetical protein
VRIPAALLYLIAAVLGLGLAFGLTRPRAHDEGIPELEAKVVRFYKAGKVFDYYTMSALYTPALQLDEAGELKDVAGRRKEEYSRFKEDTRKDLQFQADSISADSVELDIEGDWAVSSGVYRMNIDGEATEIPLEQLVWYRYMGQWWVFQNKPIELAAYGNAPDKFRMLLIKPQQGSTLTMTSSEAAGKGAAPAADESAKTDGKQGAGK